MMNAHEHHRHVMLSEAKNPQLAMLTSQGRILRFAQHDR